MTKEKCDSCMLRYVCEEQAEFICKQRDYGDYRPDSRMLQVAEMNGGDVSATQKYALKGEPDFHNLTDEKLKSFVDLAQQMIFAYKSHNTEKVKVLESIWKDLSTECTSRLIVTSEKAGSVAKAPAPMIRKVPKLRMSPAKRKI